MDVADTFVAPWDKNFFFWFLKVFFSFFKFLISALSVIIQNDNRCMKTRSMAGVKPHASYLEMERVTILSNNRFCEAISFAFLQLNSYYLHRVQMVKGGELKGSMIHVRNTGQQTQNYCTETTCSKFIMRPSRPNNQALKRTKAHSK